LLCGLFSHLTGEALVVCVTVSCPEPRPLHIRPKKSKTRSLSSGDEQIEIYPSEGDAYDMDGVMQLGYEHSLPRKKSTQSHRLAIVLRNGNIGHVRYELLCGAVAISGGLLGLHSHSVVLMAPSSK
jgi:hypothetical protein